MQKSIFCAHELSGKPIAVGKLEEPGEQDAILKTSGLAAVGKLRVRYYEFFQNKPETSEYGNAVSRRDIKMYLTDSSREFKRSDENNIIAQ